MNTAERSYKRNYAGHWALLLLLAGMPMVYRWSQKAATGSLWGPESVIPSAPAPTSGTADWFLLLRMPAITNQYESGISIMKVRYGQWLDALAQAGFHPMKLSDVYDALLQGKKLPEKTVVLVFDPGLRRTYGLIAPILRERGWPGVWLTNESAMKRGHREYVTYHATRQMIHSGWWDVGFVEKDGSIQLQSRDHAPVLLGSKDPVWSLTSGGIALNHGEALSGLHRLNVNADWTDQDLLNRVRVELPATRRVFLSKAPVQNLMWAVTTEDENDPAARFDLQVLPYKRGVVLDWFGTRGIPDAQVHAEANSLVGDFTIRLRWDEERGNGISALVSPEQLFIQELHGGHVQSVYRAERSGSDFKIDLDLQGQTLLIRLDGRAPARMALRMGAEPDRGLLQIFLVDRVRGAARAKNVHASFTPLPSTS